MGAERLHDLLERLCNLRRVEARSQGAPDGLLPVQLEALHYVSRCNRYSDTVQGVADYLGQTKGTVSQTLRVLEQAGLIRKVPDSDDRRVVHLRMTAAGKRLLSRVVPSPLLADALQGMPAAGRARLEAGLEELLISAQTRNRSRSFGVCRSCRFHEATEQGFHCGLTGEDLDRSEADLVCREHELPIRSRAKR